MDFGKAVNISTGSATSSYLNINSITAAPTAGTPFSGYNNPMSVAGTNSGTVTRTAIIPVEEFTGQINTRVRGRQMAFKIDSNALGVTWQLGAPRMDIRPDGRRGG